jgi:hypothetical protein
MSHTRIVRAAEQLVADAQALHPTDRVKQCVHIIGRRGSWTDAFAQAERDVAFDRVFRDMTDEEVQVWANYCLHQDVPAMARGRMWRATHALTERAA